MNNAIDNELDFHAKALLLLSQRQRLIASNIANADTPGYVAREMDFASALTQSMGGQGAASIQPIRVLATDSRHLSTPSSGFDTVQLQYARPSQASADRNTVDLDRERASFSDNALHYESTLRFMNFHIHNMLSAIQGQ